MGLKRMIWRSTPTGAVVDVLKNIREEGGISAGLKRTMKENVCEDNPITSRIYKKMNGKKKRTFISEEKSYSETIEKVIKKFLDGDDWKYSFDEEKGVFSFGLCMDGEIKKIDYLILVCEDSYIVYGNCSVGVNMNDKVTVANLAEFICRVNCGLPYGNFEFNYTDGTVTYKSDIYCKDIEVSDAVVEHSIYVISSMFENYGKGLLNVISGKLSPQDAIPEWKE